MSVIRMIVIGSSTLLFSLRCNLWMLNAPLLCEMCIDAIPTRGIQIINNYLSNNANSVAASTSARVARVDCQQMDTVYMLNICVQKIKRSLRFYNFNEFWFTQMTCENCQIYSALTIFELVHVACFILILLLVYMCLTVWYRDINYSR